MERINELEPESASLAYEIACNGRKQITQWQGVKCGINIALNRATTEKITFIWGPPGTGKTETLADIALEQMKQGKRVLMLSYSNVSVDGALLRVDKKEDLQEGEIIRYGFPKTRELLEKKMLISYQYVLCKNPELAAEYQKLLEKKKKLKKRDPARVPINQRMNKIRERLLEQESKLIHQASFVATTVSKALADKKIYLQRFDMVIFDEASMAYVPQIIFAAGLAKSHFVCLGDFCQLPAIVQNKTDERLSRDIFEYTGIKDAVENNQGHEWLVMLDLQYRMHQDIADFVSQYMYQGLLKTSERIYESRNDIAASYPCKAAAMSLINLSGMYSVCTKTMDGGSHINLLSALICIRLAEKNIAQYEVGIVTPYRAQSRLILTMIRDMQEADERWEKVTCATVHQFQGSEKPIIIYDAVDCFRMPYPGSLLTSLKNDTANQLFNVAITRAKGKFVLVANVDYLKRKHISNKLLFTKSINQMIREENNVEGVRVLDELMPFEKEEPVVYVEDRETSWRKYIDDVCSAKSQIYIDMPDVIDENDEAVEKLAEMLKDREKAEVDIRIRLSEDIDLPKGLQEYTKKYEYVTNPVTIIDKKIVWFGHPLYAADFVTEGEILDTEYFPCVKFTGTHTAKMIRALLGM